MASREPLHIIALCRLAAPSTSTASAKCTGVAGQASGTATSAKLPADVIQLATAAATAPGVRGRRNSHWLRRVSTALQASVSTNQAATRAWMPPTHARAATRPAHAQRSQ